MQKRLYRNRKDRVIWGVCGGLGKYFNVDPVLFRVLAVLSFFFGTLGFWIYIIMTIVVPVEPQITVTTPKQP